MQYKILVPIALLGALHTGLHAEPVQAPWLQPALTTLAATQVAFTTVVRAGGRLVAAGERGVVVTSDDGGAHWTQSKVPVSVTFCALHFVDARRGWAVGHGGVIVATEDGGVTWVKQLDGRQIPQLVKAEASATGSEAIAQAARLFEEDGPDKPFLDVLFVDAKRGWAVGGYGLFFRTEDGGRTWTSRMADVDNPKGASIYGIATDGTHFFLAGEQGYFARSSASAADFKRLATPTTASYFAIHAAPGSVVLGGLGGVLQVSTDNGASWRRVEASTRASIVALQKTAGNTVLVGTQDGGIFTADLERLRLTPVAVSPSHTLNALALAQDGRLITAGFRGVSSLAVQDLKQQNAVKAK